MKMADYFGNNPADRQTDRQTYKQEWLAEVIREHTNQWVAEEARPWTFLLAHNSATVTTVVDKIVFGRLTFTRVSTYIMTPAQLI